MDAASRSCPIVNESRGIYEGITLGDSNSLLLNAGLLSMYTLTGGIGGNANSKIKLMQSGIDASKLMIICPSSLMASSTMNLNSSND